MSEVGNNISVKMSDDYEGIKKVCIHWRSKINEYEHYINKMHTAVIKQFNKLESNMKKYAMPIKII